MAHYLNILLTLIAVGLPAYLVFRSKHYGVALGAVALWLLVFLCGSASETWSHSFLTEHPAAMEEWLMGGWAFGLVYGYLLWLVKQGFLMSRRGRLIYMQHLQVDLSTASSFGRVWRALNQSPSTIGNPLNTAYFLAASKAAPKGLQVRENRGAASSLTWAR